MYLFIVVNFRVVHEEVLMMEGFVGSAGIVEDVILLGAPVSGSVKHWEKLSHVVAGRIINGYCRLHAVTDTCSIFPVLLSE